MGRSFSVSCSLQIDRVRRDNGLFLPGHGEQDRGHQVRQGFADARARLHREMFLVLQRLRHGHGHLLLLGAKLEVFRTRQNARGREYLFHARDQIIAGGLNFGE